MASTDEPVPAHLVTALASDDAARAAFEALPAEERQALEDRVAAETDEAARERLVEQVVADLRGA